MLRTSLLFVLALGLFCLPALSQENPNPEAPEAPEASDAKGGLAPPPETVRQAIVANDTDLALEWLDKSESENPDAADRWWFYRGVALQNGKRLPEAQQAYSTLLERFPASAWVPKAHYRQAEVHRELRQFDAAETIYRVGLEELRAAGRQTEMAALYLRLADMLSAKPDDTAPVQRTPNFDEALPIYREVLNLECAQESKLRAHMGIGRCLSEKKEHRAAAVAYARVGQMDLSSEESRRWVAAELGSEQWSLQEDAAQTRRAMQDFLRTSAEAGPIENPAKDAWNRARALARRHIATSWQRQGKLDMALSAWRDALEKNPNRPDNFKVLLSIADALSAAGRTDEAVAAWQALEQSMPPAPLADAEEQALWQASKRKALYRRAETLERAERFPGAIAALREYIRQHPGGEDWPESQRKVVELERRAAYQHLEEDRFDEARSAMQAFVETHPLDPNVAQVQFDIGKTLERQATAQEPMDRDRLQAAIAHWDRLLHWGPEGTDTSQALFHIARVMEEHLGDMEGAVRNYRAAKFGNFEGQATQALQRLSKEELSIRTERTVRTDEPAKVRVQTRNLENLTVQLYALDLHAYFLKHHTAGGIQRLDLDLIAPDQEFEYAVKDYERYAPLSFEVELPVGGPGVWAVAIASETERATTLVIQSDLDMIVKTSREELFVYVQNMRTQAPAPGTTLVCSLPNSGEPELVELVTDKDGVARLSLESRADQGGEVKVLAHQEGHVASSQVLASGLHFANPLFGRCLVYPDRPAYRPGETLAWRAIARMVENDTWQAPTGTHGNVDLIDPDGNLFGRYPTQWGEFGTAHGQIILPQIAANGTWSLRIDGPGLAPHSMQFEVQEFRVPRAEIRLRTTQQVVWRGESVEVSATVQTTFGAPLSNAQLIWNLPDGRAIPVQTDALGSATWQLDTSEVSEDRILRIEAQVPDQNLTADLQVFVASRGFTLGVNAPRAVELLGSSFPLDISATAPDGKGIAQTLDLQAVLRIEQPGGRWGEELLFERKIETDDLGTVTVPIQIDRGGNVVLRVKGQDRFGQTLEAQTLVTIAGEQDKVKLRLLTETPQVGVADTVELTAVNRAQKGLALMTLETGTVRSYRLIELAAGVQTISVPMDPSLAPNVMVTLAMMQGDRFFEAATQLILKQDLQITFEDKGEPVPGERSPLVIQVRDHNGNPVQTELSLAIVDEALYQLYEDRVPALQNFFLPPHREFPTIQTKTSCTFAYQGSTQPIAQSILDEAQRREQEEQWLLTRDQVVDNLGDPEKQVAAVQTMDLDDTIELFEPVTTTSFIGVGGGAGGKYGGRMGGKKNLSGMGRSTPEEGAKSPDSPSALWRADVVTDGEGRATIDVDWPKRSTRWRLTAHGVGSDNHFGSGVDFRSTEQPFFVELVGPASLMQGDTPQLLARVYDQTNTAGEVQLELIVEGMDKPYSQSATLRLGQGNITEHLFTALPPMTGTAGVRARVTVAGSRDGIELSSADPLQMEVRRPGLVRYDHAAGVLTDLETLELELGGTERFLELRIASDLQTDLIAMALGELAGPYHCRLTRGPAELASDLMAACAVLQGMTQNQGHPRYRALMDRALSLTALLGSMQNSQGGFAWSGHQTGMDPYTTAHVAVSLGRARELGIQFDGKGLGQLLKALTKTSRETDSDDLKAFLHHALARLDRSDFAALNRLHRSRSQLSTAGKLHLALALVLAERKPMAAEILGELEGDAGKRPLKVAQGAVFLQSPVELNAWALIAMQAAGVGGDSRAAAADYLQSQKPWRQRKAQGVAIWALALDQTLMTAASGQTTIRVEIDDGAPEEWILGSGENETPALTKRFPLPDATGNQAKGKTRVRLQLVGPKPVRYTALLGGFVPAEKTLDNPGFRIQRRRVLADDPRYQGQVLPTGFGRTVRSKSWVNERSQVRRGELVHLSIQTVAFSRGAQSRRWETDYLELEVPLPAGVELLQTESPANRPYRKMGSSLVFPIEPGGSSFAVELDLVGRFPGNYQFPPAILRHAYQPDRIFVHEASGLEVLPRDGELTDIYKPTPDEMFARGEAHYTDEDWQGTRAALIPLLDGFEQELRGDSLAATGKMLLFASIDLGSPAEIVRYFEIVKERDAELFVPLDQVLKIGNAYSSLGEHERAMLIFRASLEETFGSDLKLVGLLDRYDQWLPATQLLGRLVAAYPDLPVVQESSLALADRILRKAPQAGHANELEQAGLNRATLTAMGVRHLRQFLAMYADSPLAPDAGLNLVAAFFSLEDFETTAELCVEMAKAFPKPEYRASFRYSEAVARWYLGQEEAALEQLKGVARDSGNTQSGPLKDRDLAHYMMAQIYHAQQNIHQAKEFYGMVKDQLPDALWALKSLDTQQLEFTREVERILPGEPASLEIRYRGLTQVELLAYPVDLMTLYLRERDLSRVTQVNLAGISATLSKTIELGQASPLRPTKHQASLELPEAGAYLVMARGGDQHASCLVLVSDLEVVVQELADGQVRIQAFDAKSGSYLHDVDVRALGTNSAHIQAGKTDRRGLFVATGIQGKATVIARLDRKQYAFHLGARNLGNQRQRESGQPSQEQGVNFWLQNVNMRNDQGIDSRNKNLDREIKRVRQGVQVKQVK